jgi:hypothetical protein
MLILETRRLLRQSAQIREHWLEDTFGECEMAEQPSCPVCGCAEVSPTSYGILVPGTELRVFAYRCGNGHRFLVPEVAEGEARESAA